MRIGRKGWWVGALVAVWAGALLVAAVWSAQHDPATVRGQTDLTEGRQNLDRAVALLVETAGPGVTPDVGPLRQATGCRVTMVRRGTELDQSVLLTVPAGQEPTLLERLVDDLPAEWSARYDPGNGRFFADAGDFVAIRGGIEEPGLVRLTAETGCRPSDAP
ncbi:MAG: hypothetical protein GEV12_18410 [Micromonosporaceae bacterium]|nr:hypothetical protein [Micromonosporaceae bacterium]